MQHTDGVGELKHKMKLPNFENNCANFKLISYLGCL